MSGTPAPDPASAGAARPGLAAPMRARRGRRGVLIALAATLLTLILVVATAPWWFNARRVASLAMDQADRATGLDWSFAGEPALRWRPSPWLALPGLRVVDAQARTVLSVERAELALPWSTLRGEGLRIDALLLQSPDVDLDAALDWWNARPATAASELPVLNGVSISGGALRWRGGRLDSLDARLLRFAIGEPLALDASGRITMAADAGAAPAAAPEPFEVRLGLAATPRDAPLRLDGITLDLSGSGPVPTARASGRLAFNPWHLEASGALAAWPEAWPALPPPLSASAAPITFSVSQAGDSALDAPLRLSARRDEASTTVALVPRELLAWLDASDAPLLPPITGSAAMPAVEIDGIALEGVSVEIVEEPASEAQATAAPAPSPDHRGAAER